MSLIKVNSLILFTCASFSRPKQLTVLTELFIPPVTCASSTHLWVFSTGANLLCSTGISNYSVSGLCRIIKLVWLGVHWKTVVLRVIMKARSTFIHLCGISAVDLKMHERLWFLPTSFFIISDTENAIIIQMTVVWEWGCTDLSSVC